MVMTREFRFAIASSQRHLVGASTPSGGGVPAGRRVKIEDARRWSKAKRAGEETVADHSRGEVRRGEDTKDVTVSWTVCKGRY